MNLVEKEEEKVKKAFENELMILTLKLKKLKTMRDQREKEKIIGQETIKMQVENEIKRMK